MPRFAGVSCPNRSTLAHRVHTRGTPHADADR
jgi:hypothetical protein